LELGDIVPVQWCLRLPDWAPETHGMEAFQAGRMTKTPFEGSQAMLMPTTALAHAPHIRHAAIVVDAH